MDNSITVQKIDDNTVQVSEIAQTTTIATTYSYAQICAKLDDFTQRAIRMEEQHKEDMTLNQTEIDKWQHIKNIADESGII